MQVMWTGLFLWVVAVIALVRVAAIGCCGSSSSRVHVWMWVVLLSVAVLLLFRPHEDLFGGQDQGSYVNSAVTYAREGRLFHEDALLSQVPPDTRPDFLYRGHRGVMPTKLHVLRLEDAHSATMQPWFQPAFPVLMSVVARAGFPFGVLFVAPFFALLTAVVIGVLSRQMFDDKWVGVLAFVFYLCSPLVAWHGRCARAELPAAFFIISGAVLLFHACVGGGKRRIGLDVFLSGICFSLAPFFHITAMLAAIPAACVVVVLILCGRRALLLYWLPVVAGGVVFILQTRSEIDPYRIAGWFDWVCEHRAVVAVLLLVVLSALGAMSSAERSAAAVRRAVGWIGAGRRVAYPAAVLTTGVLLATAVFRGTGGGGLFKSNSMLHVLGLADTRGFTRLVSLPVALAGLCGWISWFLRTRGRRWGRVVTALAVLPGLMLGGAVSSGYMYSSRYMLMFLAPVLAISLASLVAVISAGFKSRGLASLCLALVIGLSGMRNRTHLYLLREYRGFTGYLESVADMIRQENGILLFEYSRIAAPMNHFFGIPALGLDNEENQDYADAEEAWARIMRENAGRPAFFITPFARLPKSDRFSFEPLAAPEFACRRLRAARDALPTEIGDWQLRLSVYRMRRRDGSDVPEDKSVFPYLFPFDMGNMGVKRFAGRRTTDIAMNGILFGARQRRVLAVPTEFRRADAEEIWLFFFSRDGGVKAPSVSCLATPGVSIDGLVPLADGWWLCRIGGESLAVTEEISLTASAELFLADVQCLVDGRLVRTDDALAAEAGEQMVAPDTEIRWARDGGRFLVPLPGGGGGFVLCFLSAPGKLEGPVRISAGIDDSVLGEGISMMPGEWRWCVWPLASVAAGQAQVWVAISSDRTFDSGRHSRSADLAAAIAYGVVLEE